MGLWDHIAEIKGFFYKGVKNAFALCFTLFTSLTFYSFNDILSAVKIYLYGKSLLVFERLTDSNALSAKCVMNEDCLGHGAGN